MGNENFASVDILRVETAPDLGSARVYVNSAVGAKELEKSVGFLRTEIANNMKIKRVPNLRFIVDNGEQNAQRVDELLKIINGGAK
jgi:ribosome-binding factor A